MKIKINSTPNSLLPSDLVSARECHDLLYQKLLLISSKMVELIFPLSMFSFQLSVQSINDSAVECNDLNPHWSGYVFWPLTPRQSLFFEIDSKNRVPNLYYHSQSGCIFSVLFGTLQLVLTYFCLFLEEVGV